MSCRACIACHVMPRIPSFGRSGQTAANGPKGATYSRRTCSTRTAAEKQDKARDAASTQTFPRDRSGVASSAKKSAFSGNRAAPSVGNHARPVQYANVHRAPSSSDADDDGLVAPSRSSESRISPVADPDACYKMSPSAGVRSTRTAAAEPTRPIVVRVLSADADDDLMSD